MSTKWLKVTAALGLSVSLLGGPTASASTKPAWQQNNDFLKNYVPMGHNVYKPEKKTQEISTDTLVIKVTKPITQTDLRKSGTTLVRSIPSLGYTVVKVKNKKNFQKAADYFSKSSKVTAVTPSMLSLPLGYADPKVSKQYFLNTLKINEAQKLAGKHKVKVAVIDQGIDRNHPELDSRVSASINAADPLNNPLPDFHGTHVAGIIAAEKDNGIGGYGVNPNADLISIDVFDRGWGASDFVIAEGILEAVERGAKVINMSLGSSFRSPIIEEAVQIALSKNITIVASAGNSGSDTPNYPASFEGVISVGSTNSKNQLSDFSTYGPAVDVVAPGEDIYAPLYDYEYKSMFYNLSGTSMASPMVAGLASLILSKYPSLKPAEVEYMIEQTAKDLGSKGYDRKYANGLIQPVAALKFNPKHIPAAVKTPQSEEEILKAATALKFTGSTTKKAYFTKPGQVHWYKFPVAEGEKIQTTLTGVANYDYKYDIMLLSEDGMDLVTVNQHQDNETEAKLYSAPVAGHLLIGVSDANNNYDDTAGKSSNYSLNIARVEGLTDANTEENMTAVTALPFTGTETIFNEEGTDTDFYEFTVDQAQMVKVSTTGIPGVNTALRASVKMKPEAEEPEKPETPETTVEGETGTAGEGEGDTGTEGTEGGEGEEMPEYVLENIAMSDNGGVGKGEQVTFLAEPGMTYVVDTTNEPLEMEEFYFEDVAPPEISSLPYSIKMESKVFPEDEDEFGGYEEEEEEYEEDEYAEDPMMIWENAPRYSIGNKASGYMQDFGDVDYFAFTARASGVYEFKFDSKALPMATLYKLEQVEEEEGTFTYPRHIATNYDYGWEGVIINKKLIAGLEKGAQYFIRLNTDEMSNSIPFDPYSFTSKILFSNVEESYEPNNDLSKTVQSLPAGNSVRGKFASAGDFDPYYIKAKQDGIMNVSIKKDTVTSELTKKYPKELLADYLGLILVMEDTNQNKKIDEDEFNTLKLFSKNVYSGTTRGSFKAKKNQGYFVVAEGWVMSTSNLSLIPYTLKVDSANKKDEDAGSVVKNNKPSKPLTLKKSGTSGYKYSGYLNVNNKGGDSDWFEYKTTKTKKVKISFSTAVDNDGVINLYRNGKKVASANYYVDGDDEVLNFTARPGTYYVEVKDRFGRSSTVPYHLSIK